MVKLNVKIHKTVHDFLITLEIRSRRLGVLPILQFVSIAIQLIHH